jgi:hypothetical protein
VTIDIEGLYTWPKSIVEILTESFEVLRNYERERKRIDVAARLDVRLRNWRPPNPFSQRRDIVLQRIDELIADEDTLGFHWTRLHAEEIISIKREGLQPLSAAKLRFRIEERIKAGDIPAGLGRRLLADHQADDDHRKGMIWFVNSRSCLTDCSGVFRLFRNWGGESLYNSHERDPETGPLLQSVGVPCIVVAVLPISRIRTYHNVAEKFIWSFLGKHGIKTDHSPELEGYLEEPIQPAQVRSIIDYEDQRFEALTRCKSWPWSIT